MFLDWIRLATEIELNYHFDAFVILHGTDTMSYTSSALSFLLEDLGKTVVRENGRCHPGIPEYPSRLSLALKFPCPSFAMTL